MYLCIFTNLGCKNGSRKLKITYTINLFTGTKKPKLKSESFYNKLQNIVQSLPSHQRIILLGDFNARIGNEIISGIKQRLNENVFNDNGEVVIDICTFNELRINNTIYN